MDFTAFRATVSPAAIAENWTEATSNRIPYLGETLFPAKKKAGLDLAWIKGNKGVPVTLMPSAFDAKATFRDRIGVQKVETEMPFFREGFKLKEKDRQEILRAIDTNDAYVREVIARVYDDAQNLIEGAMVVPERMIMQLLFPIGGEVGITIKANGVDYTYDYDANDAWKGTNYFALTGNALWTAVATADPFADIQTAKDAVAAKGGLIRYAAMNSATFRLLRSVAAVKNRFLTTNGLSVGYLSDNDIVNVLKDTLDLEGIIIYDKQYANENKVVTKFVPDGYVALIPDGALGNTWRGTTPEEADLLGKAVADVALVENGIAITQETTVNPVNVNTFASEIVLPSYERMDEVAVLKVTADG
jgi:hypothetical protein